MSVGFKGTALGAGMVASGSSPTLRRAWVAAAAAAVRPTVWTNWRRVSRWRVPMGYGGGPGDSPHGRPNLIVLVRDWWSWSSAAPLRKEVGGVGDGDVGTQRRPQFLAVERLLQEDVRAGGEGGRLLIGQYAGAGDHHRDAIPPGVGLPLAHEGQSIDLRHHDVQDEQLGHAVRHQAEGLSGAVGDFGLESVGAQDLRHDLGKRDLIVDDKDGIVGRHGSSLLERARTRPCHGARDHRTPTAEACALQSPFGYSSPATNSA